MTIDFSDSHPRWGISRDFQVFRKYFLLLGPRHGGSNCDAFCCSSNKMSYPTSDESEEYRRMYELDMGYEPTPQLEHVSPRRVVRRCSVTEHVLRAQQQEFMAQEKRERQENHQQQQDQGYNSSYSSQQSGQMPRTFHRPRHPFPLAKTRSLSCVVHNVGVETEQYESLRFESANRSSASRAA